MKVAHVTDEQLEKVDPSTLQPNRPDVTNNKLEILAGPILRFWGLSKDPETLATNGRWRGSVSYVTRDTGSTYDAFPFLTVLGRAHQKPPLRFATVEGLSFWRFDLDIPTHPMESVEIHYQLGDEHKPYSFWIPGQSQTMRTMFYSCNGFSLGVDTETFPACLWDDVIRQHSGSPFHVMLGGGDQLYCDSINLILPENTLKSRDPLPDEPRMRELMNKFYLHQYVDWYGRGYWKGKAGETYQHGWVETLATIPSLNIWDDHDIIDGYGTYRDSTMRSPVFKMIGEYAYIYYMLFQQNVSGSEDAKLNDPSWITSPRPGPYINEPARSIYARLGLTAAFLGLDCRTERKIDQVCRPEHYDLVFQRLRNELSANPEIKHIYLMLGVPIAYPRMVWAENLMSSRLIGPVKWLSKKGIILKGLVNPFDGDVELLDDLNDHWTAKYHKRERNKFLDRLMHLQKEKSVRVTILTGDVHLAAVGVFASIKPTSPEFDSNFMVCPVSSAIVNTPPPPALSDFMNRRNRTHILGATVAERMIPIFSNHTDGKKAGHNKTMLAKRNYCILDPMVTIPPELEGTEQYAGPMFGETEHLKKPEKHNKFVKVVPGSIRMTLRVEKDNANPDPVTVPYQMYIPTLQSKKPETHGH